MSLLLETIKIKDGVAINLHLHEERMKRSVSDLYGQDLAVDLQKTIRCPAHLVSGVVKCRVTYSNSIDSITYEPYQFRLIRSLKLVYDNSIDYRYKYLDRSCFAHHLQGIGEDDILIIKDGLITDTSFSNLLFWDGSGWLTPKAPLLFGIKRQQLIEAGFIAEADIRPEDLHQFAEVRIINAMLDPKDNPGIKDIRI